MTATVPDLSPLVDQATEALRRGDAQAALAVLRPVAEHDPAPAQFPWLLLAQAERLAGNPVQEEAALDKLLALHMRHVPALFMKGQAREAASDDRGARSFYQAALNQLAFEGQSPSQLQPIADHAKRFLGAAQRRFEDHLASSLDGLGGGPRITQALDLLTGKRELYFQQPSMFYFPELPQRQFYEPYEFPWLTGVVDTIPAMVAELEAALGHDASFVPYVASDTSRPRPANHLLDDPSWGAFYFWQNGEQVSDHAALCPATMAALAKAPIPVIAGRSPMALWSRLSPGTHIKPHHGMLNTRLIVHVPLIAPIGCGLRVGNETREWRLGEPLIFDDSFEHEAWNRGTSDRVILLFEIWRPEIDEQERAALVRLFEAIDAYQGVTRDQG